MSMGGGEVFAVELGVGGTQALTSIVADVNLTDTQKKELLMILFGMEEDQVNRIFDNGTN